MVATRRSQKRKLSTDDDQTSSSSKDKQATKQEKNSKNEAEKVLDEPDTKKETKSKANKKTKTEEDKTVYDYPPVEDSVMENGHIYFLYRPKLDVGEPESISDVQRIYMILKPRYVKPSQHKEERQPTMIIIGSKKLPSSSRHDRYWSFVAASSKNMDDLVADLRESTHETKTRGERTTPAARILGEGIYCIAKRGIRNTYLAYILKTPEAPTEVQNAFQIKKEASMVISVKNPEMPPSSSSRAPSYQDQKKPEYPDWLMETFKQKRFVPMTETTLYLNYKSTQVVLIGARESIDKDELGEGSVEALSELSEEEDEETESKSNKRILDHLHLKAKDIPLDPLEGEWK